METSPIFVGTYDLLKWLLAHTVTFPKTQRFLLAKRIEDAALGFHAHIIRAGKPGGSGQDLREADIELTKLRLYLRLAMDMHLLGIGQYEHVSRMVDEVGKLLGGWLRNRASRRQRTPDAGELLPA